MTGYMKTLAALETDFESHEVKKIKNAASALFSNGFPCNPLPFLSALTLLCKAEGTRALEGDIGKSILWILIAMAHGQMTVIDMSDEWSRLHELYLAITEDKNAK